MTADLAARERLRLVAAASLLGTFLLAAQFAPVAHLASHRPDHTHGPDDVEHLFGDEAAHLAAHQAGRTHTHPRQPVDAPRPRAAHEPAASASGTLGDRRLPETSSAGNDDPVPTVPTRPHGHGSSLHFGLAVLEGPLPPFLPPPPETLALPPDEHTAGHRPRRFRSRPPAVLPLSPELVSSD
ncbi:MAG: hypothetical protein R2745_19610 [Vicinamibacterales bacterium]